MSITALKKAPCKITIDALETLLEEAKSGEMRGFAYAMMHHDGRSSSGSVGVLDKRIIADLEEIKMNILGFGATDYEV